MNSCGLEEDFGGSTPDHDNTIDGLSEILDVGADLVGKVFLVLPLLDVRSVQALDVVLIEYRRERLDGFEIGLELLKGFFLEDLGVRGALVDVVCKDVPAGEDDVIQIGKWDEVFYEGRFVVSTLTEADGPHLRK